MRVKPVIVFLVFILVCLPMVEASTSTLQWTFDVRPGYITTSPVADEDHVYIRTSGYWTGDQRPEVFAITHQGEIAWQHENPNSTQHDMAPLILIESGEGPCGQWPNLLLVGWANGQFEALSPIDGTRLWLYNSSSEGWGITGASVIENDHVVVPLSHGVAKLCLADGTPELEIEIGAGWRNGVSLSESGYWIGDEQGTLWHIGEENTASAMLAVNGAIRHAPIVLGHHILIHAQQAERSVVYAYDTLSGGSEQIAISGRSPALPLSYGYGVIFGDSEALTTVECEDNCFVVSQLPAHTNGELSWFTPTSFFAPLNTPSGGIMVVNMSSEGELHLSSILETAWDGYATSSPCVHQGSIYIGNDAGILMSYRSDAPTSSDESQPSALLSALALSVTIFSVAWMASFGRIRQAWSWYIAIVLCMSIAMFPDALSAWNEIVIDDTSATNQEMWNESWPETWRGTQIVVFEFEDETKVAGGFVGYSDVYSLTSIAVDTLGIEMQVETMTLGMYLVSLDEIEGAGWEFFINAERGQVAMDVAMIETPVVLTWRLA